MGKSRQAKRRALDKAKKKQAKRAAALARRAARGGARGEADSMPGCWAATPALVEAQQAFQRTMAQALEAYREALSVRGILDEPDRGGLPTFSGMGLQLRSLHAWHGQGYRIVRTYRYLGHPAWSATRQDARRKASQGLPKRLRPYLPDSESPRGWLGCWTVRYGEGDERPSVTDWLADLRPAPAFGHADPPASLRAASTRALREPPRPLHETLDVDPTVFLAGEKTPLAGRRVVRFLGWCVERDGMLGFVPLVSLAIRHVQVVTTTVRRALAVGLIQTPADWDGYLLATAAAAHNLGRPGVTYSWVWAFEVLATMQKAWRSAGVSPWNLDRVIQKLGRLPLSSRLMDPEDLDDAEDLREAATSVLSGHAAGASRPLPGIELLLSLAVDLLPLAVARAGADGDGEGGAPSGAAGRGERAPAGAPSAGPREAVEAALQDVREALRLFLIPYRGLDPTQLRALWDVEFLAGSLGLPGLERVAAWDEAALLARPLAWLGLGAEHPAAQALGPLATVGAGLRWARNQARRSGNDGEREAARALEAAYGEARAEARLCELLGPPPKDARPANEEAAAWLRNLMLGLRGVFDARALAAPVESLPLPQRGRVRVLNALANLAPVEADGAPEAVGPRGEGPTIAALPGELRALLEVPGLGTRSADYLLTALWKYATSWREAFVPRDAARAVARVSAPERDEARARLAGGLDALADLFGDGTETGGAGT